MELIVMALLLCASAFFSASETAFFSLPKYHIRRLREENTKAAKTILSLLSNQHRLIVTILFGNMCVNILYSSFAIFFAAKIAEKGGVAAFALVNLIALIVLIIFGELAPKAVAIRAPFRLSELAAPILLAFQKIVTLPRVILETVGGFFTNLIHPRTKKQIATITELRNLITLGKESGALDTQEGNLISEVIEFGTIEVREVMTPRVDIVCFHISEPVEELRKIILESGHSKIPTYTLNLDYIDSVIHSKDVILYPNKPLKDLARPILCVPEKARVESVLKQLLEKRKTIAIVVDEYGGTQGLVTLEDILEEIVGEIEDEYDRGRKKVVELSPDRFLIWAGITLREWNEISGSLVADTRFETIGGYVSALLDKVPEVDDITNDGSYKFTIKRVDKHRVRTILAERLRNNKKETE
ncbi:MAG: hemolysin family protein [Planctomycetota bacterium]